MRSGAWTFAELRGFHAANRVFRVARHIPRPGWTGEYVGFCGLFFGAGSWKLKASVDAKGVISSEPRLIEQAVVDWHEGIGDVNKPSRCERRDSMNLCFHSEITQKCGDQQLKITVT